MEVENAWTATCVRSPPNQAMQDVLLGEMETAANLTFGARSKFGVSGTAEAWLVQGVVEARWLPAAARDCILEFDHPTYATRYVQRAQADLIRHEGGDTSIPTAEMESHRIVVASAVVVAILWATATKGGIRREWAPQQMEWRKALGQAGLSQPRNQGRCCLPCRVTSMLLQVNVPVGTFLHSIGPPGLDRARLPPAYTSQLRSATNKEFFPVDRLLLQEDRP
jgi:hypothetical protein